MKKKNKLLIMVFTLVAFLSFGVMNVNADENVGSVTLDGTGIIPVVGKTPASLDLMLPEDVPYEVRLEAWYLSSPEDPYTGKFVDGDEYGYALALCPKEGSDFTFDANDTLTISGIPWKTFRSMVSPNPALEGCMVALASYIASTIAIEEVNISDIVVPIEGGLPQHDSGVAYPNTALDTPGGSGFYKNSSDTTPMDYMTPFVENDNIFYKSVFQVIPGYFIDENTVFKYNGEVIENISETSGVYTAIIPFTVQSLVYNYLQGANLSTSNLDELTFKIDADYSLFSTGGKVYVDDTLVDASNYVATSGSTIITLDENYAATLGVGEHRLKVVFNNGGEAETRFTIESQREPSSNPNENNNENENENGTSVKPVQEDNSNSLATENPQTGDSIGLYIILGLVSVIGIVGTTIYTKRFN